MMCCNNCPFNPNKDNCLPKCDNPICKSQHQGNDELCARNLGNRCFMDYYVIDHLFQEDELAEGLAMESLQTALIGRDRALLLSLFQAASDELRMKMWSWLEENEPRSLWMLNPIFVANGLPELTNFAGTGSRRNQYLDAIIANEYSGRYYKSAYNM